VAVLLGAAVLPTFAATTKGPQALADRYAKVLRTVDQSILFEENMGQSGESVAYTCIGDRFILNLAANEINVDLRTPTEQKRNVKPTVSQNALTIRLLDAHPSPAIKGLAETPIRRNHLVRKDSSIHSTTVPTYAEVSYENVYNGIDLVYHGNQGHLEYDFIVAPGSDPSVIRMEFAGIEDLTLSSRGNLKVNVAKGAIIQHKPIIYQVIDGEKVFVDGSFVLHGGNHIGFDVAAYDTTRTLVIDPTFSFEPGE
jgi:hypothetical protein